MSRSTIDPIPLTDYDTNRSQNIESIKVISQQIIEEKEAILVQIYKQLKTSLSTISFLTQQIGTLKGSLQQVDMKSLKQKEFLRQQNGRHIMVLDITKALMKNKQTLKIDIGAQILNEASERELFSKFKAIQEGYRRSLQQSELLLKTLSEKENTEAALLIQIRSLTSQQVTFTTKIKELQEELQMLDLELDQEKRQRALQKTDWNEERINVKKEIQQKNVEIEIQKQKYAYLLSLNNQLASENNNLKQLQKIPVKRDDSHYPTLHGQLPLHQSHIKQYTPLAVHLQRHIEDDFQSPLHLLPYQIKPTEPLLISESNHQHSQPTPQKDVPNRRSFQKKQPILQSRKHLMSPEHLSQEKHISQPQIEKQDQSLGQSLPQTLSFNKNIESDKQAQININTPLITEKKTPQKGQQKQEQKHNLKSSKRRKIIRINY